MCLMALCVFAPSSMGAVKTNEPEYGKLYNLTVTGSTRVDWDIHVNYGDNVSINCTEVPGKPMGCDVGFSVDCIYCPLYYKTSCCDTTMDSGSAFYAASNRTIWFVAADDTVIHVALWNALANSQANYTINKVNATASSQSADITKLESMVESLNQTVNALAINVTNLSAHIQQTDGNLSVLQEKLAEMSAEFKSLSDNLTALKARLDSLNIPEAVNISGIQQNITDLSASYEDLYQNITELANRTGNITYQNVTYENKTLVTNETVVYAYDNGTVGNISKGLEDLGKRVAEVNKSLPEEIAKVNGNVDKLRNNTKSSESISKEMGEATGTVAGVGLGAGIAAGAGTSMAIGKRNSRAPIKGRPEDEIVPTGGLKTGELEEFPKPPEQDKGQ